MKNFEKLEYTNSRGESITFGIGSKYHVNVIREVTGISDIDDTIYSTNSMEQHGDTLVGVRFEPRIIEIKGKITERDHEAGARLRRQALKILNPELDGTLTYTFGDFARKITAKVDGTPKFTHPDLFEVFNITFKCLSPFWLENEVKREEIAGWIADWIFPTVIDKDDPTSMIYGHREPAIIVDVYNSGHVSAGMKVEFKALGALTNPQIFNVNTREFMKVNYTMAAGDKIIIDTSFGSKSIRLISQGVESNIYRYMDVDSTFMQLDIGDNLFRYDADSGVDNLDVVISYNPQYLGV